MIRTRLPTLDASDRRIVGIALVLALAWLVLCVMVGLGLGAGFAVFRLLSGG